MEDSGVGDDEVEINPTLKYVLVMGFVAIAMLFYLRESSVDFLAGVGIWTFVVLGFGTYLYFRVFHLERKDPDKPEDPDE